LHANQCAIGLMIEIIPEPHLSHQSKKTFLVASFDEFHEGEPDEFLGVADLRKRHGLTNQAIVNVDG